MPYYYFLYHGILDSISHSFGYVYWSFLLSIVFWLLRIVENRFECDYHLFLLWVYVDGAHWNFKLMQSFQYTYVALLVDFVFYSNGCCCVHIFMKWTMKITIYNYIKREGENVNCVVYVYDVVNSRDEK